jgi:general secretion pathway protein G
MGAKIKITDNNPNKFNTLNNNLNVNFNKKLSISNNDNGFTLIELLIVLVIIAILATIIVPRIMFAPHKAKETAVVAQIKNFETALAIFKLQNGFYPTTAQGLEALVKKPVIPPVPKHYEKGGYLSHIPSDPWGNKYIYISPSKHGSYAIISYGPTGAAGGTGKNAPIESWKIK